jgi:hypothetical protein
MQRRLAQWRIHAASESQQLMSKQKRQVENWQINNLASAFNIHNTTALSNEGKR